jgi:hypothetical protein
MQFSTSAVEGRYLPMFYDVLQLHCSSVVVAAVVRVVTNPNHDDVNHGP